MGASSPSCKIPPPPCPPHAHTHHPHAHTPTHIHTIHTHHPLVLLRAALLDGRGPGQGVLHARLCARTHVCVCACVCVCAGCLWVRVWVVGVRGEFVMPVDCVSNDCIREGGCRASKGCSRGEGSQGGKACSTPPLCPMHTHKVVLCREGK